MTVEVLIFGAAAVALEGDRVTVTVGGTTVRDVLAALGEQCPDLRFALPAARLAVNRAIAKPDMAISAGDELALISLIGGG